jgi:peptidoglycan/xylan/chitin deacetylase (PgdA/CDA1 family)/glycosyltransferase involved in cell wall biosynthesis
MIEAAHIRPDAPFLSAIVSAYHNEETILRVVGALVAQQADSFEVIVATSGGDRTGELVRQTFPEVLVKEWPTRLLPGGVRNLGASLARGRILAFLEGDMVPCPDWVANRMRAHRAGHEVVAGAVNAKLCRSRASRGTSYFLFGNRLPGLPAETAKVSRSYGLSFTREVFGQAGPFDEMVRIEEDTLMTERLLRLGHRIWFEPSIWVEHIGPTHFGEMLRDQTARGRREARAHLLKWGPGRGRMNWEGARHLGSLLITLRTVRYLVLRGQWLAGDLRDGNADRRDLLLTLPWILSCLVANGVGWGLEQLAFLHANPYQLPTDAVFVDTPFRSRVATNGEKVVALTFENQPSENTEALLRILDSCDVPATFFLTGEAAQSMPGAVRSIASHGHAIGINGWSYRRFTELSPEVLDEELDQTLTLLRDIVATESRYVRPPFGCYDLKVISELAARRLAIWLWSFDERQQSSPVEALSLADGLSGRITPGGVLLLQDNVAEGHALVTALPTLIEGILARKFRFVSLGYAQDQLSLDPPNVIRSFLWPDSDASIGETWT